MKMLLRSASITSVALLTITPRSESSRASAPSAFDTSSSEFMFRTRDASPGRPSGAGSRRSGSAGRPVALATARSTSASTAKIERKPASSKICRTLGFMPPRTSWPPFPRSFFTVMRRTRSPALLM